MLLLLVLGLLRLIILIGVAIVVLLLVRILHGLWLFLLLILVLLLIRIIHAVCLRLLLLMLPTAQVKKILLISIASCVIELKEVKLIADVCFLRTCLLLGCEP